MKFTPKVKIRIKKIDFGNIALVLAERAFELIIGFMILALFWGVWLYVKYVSSPVIISSGVETIRFQQEKYQKVLEEMRSRDDKFIDSGSKIFKNIFKGLEEKQLTK